MTSTQDGDFYTRHGYPRPGPAPRPAPPYQPNPTGSPPPHPAAPPPRPWWRRNITLIIPWTLVGMLTAAMIWLLLPGFSSDDAAPATTDVTVNFVLNDADTAFAGCVGQGGYGDIGPGTPVTVKNESGQILGAASLGRGVEASSLCSWSVTIAGVPLGESFYSAEVGSRGAITYSAAELKDAGYKFSVSLG